MLLLQKENVERSKKVQQVRRIMEILLFILVIAPTSFETANCLLPAIQEEHGNTGIVCNWTEDNFEKNFYLNIGNTKPPEYRWEMKREYSKDNFIERAVRREYWKRRDNGS